MQELDLFWLVRLETVRHNFKARGQLFKKFLHPEADTFCALSE